MTTQNTPEKARLTRKLARAKLRTTAHAAAAATTSTINPEWGPGLSYLKSIYRAEKYRATYRAAYKAELSASKH